MFFRLCIFVLWVTSGTLSLPWNLCLGVWRQWSLVGGWLIIVSSLEGFVLGVVQHLNTVTEQSQRQHSSYRQMVMFAVCARVRVSVCVSAHTGWSFWSGGGGELKFGEMWREVSRGTADETPTPASCCLRWAHQQPAWLPVFAFCPVKAPQHPCPTADSSQLFQAFWSPSYCAPWPPRKNKTHTHTHTLTNKCGQRWLKSGPTGEAIFETRVSSRVVGHRS